MKRSQKHISLCLLLALILNLFIITGVSADDARALTEIRPITLANNWEGFTSVNYCGKDMSSKLTLDDVMDKDDFLYILEVFSAENLVYDRPASKESEETIPTKGSFWIVEDNELSTNWDFYFDETSVYVYKTDVNLDLTTDSWNGWFTYKDSSIYKELEARLEAFAIERKQQIAEAKESPLKDEEWVSNIEIIYGGSVPSESFSDERWWGLCSYLKDGEKIITPYITFQEGYYNGQQVFYLGSMISENVVYFDMTKGLNAYDSGATGRIYDCSVYNTWLYNYQIEAIVNKTGLVREVLCTAVRKENSKFVITDKIDMQGVPQRGSLFGYFKTSDPSESNVASSKESTLDTVIPVPENGTDNTPKVETPEEIELEKSANNTESKEETTEKTKEQITETKENEEGSEHQAQSKGAESTDTTVEETQVASTPMTYEGYAANLAALGLFRGTENGYELESDFTRAEAATMLVRLLGKEQEVLKTTPQEIFADVPADHWAIQYIEYCYQNNITKGTGDHQYSPEEATSGSQYLTLVLRALGYHAVEPANAKDAAIFYRLTDSAIATEICQMPQLSRDKMVYISYQSLTVMQPNGKRLIDTLIAENAVDATIARELDLIE